MSQTVLAIYEDGVFKPLESPNLPESERVRLTVEAVTSDDGPQSDNGQSDPLAGVRVATGIPDLAENFDDYRFGKRRP